MKQLPEMYVVMPMPENLSIFGFRFLRHGVPNQYRTVQYYVRRIMYSTERESSVTGAVESVRGSTVRCIERAKQFDSG